MYFVFSSAVVSAEPLTWVLVYFKHLQRITGLPALKLEFLPISQGDNRVAAQLLESIIFIIDSVLPLLRKLPQSVIEELEQDLKHMIVRHSFLTVVHACIK